MNNQLPSHLQVLGQSTFLCSKVGSPLLNTLFFLLTVSCSEAWKVMWKLAAMERNSDRKG